MSHPSSSAGSYVDHVAQLEQRLNTDDALRRAVGGEFLAIGRLEYHLLRSRGLKDHHVVVDVGCGSGRLACQLAPFPGMRYIGCDVVPRLLDYARELCGRPDWRFEQTNGTTIPCADAQADIVCFFSVFTHLSQDDIFRYFRETQRVLKPGGLMILSFLEFRVPAHWATFIASVDRTRDDEHLNQFVDRDSLHAWAAATGFNVLGIHAGNTDYIPLPEEITFENGARASGATTLGQSVAVLQKREPGAASAAASPPAPSASTESDTPVWQDVVTALPATAPTAPLVNVSARGHVAPGAMLMAGFTIGGKTDRRVLIRAIGPSLRLFGHPTPLPRPQLEVHAGEKIVAQNAGGWATDPRIATAAATVGAFAISPDDQDAVILATLPPGSYTALVKGMTANDQGEVVTEVYLID